MINMIVEMIPSANKILTTNEIVKIKDAINIARNE